MGHDYHGVAQWDETNVWPNHLHLKGMVRLEWDTEGMAETP